MGIEFVNINKFYAKNHVLKDINLSIKDGEFLTLLGPSGCGKTTTLRLIAGLEKPENGKILFNGWEVDNGETNYHLDSAKRDLSMVFQSYALWPHMTVYQNVAFGLEVKKVSPPKIKERVIDSLEKMQIPDLKNRYPRELSGGQQQRVAIARAIVTEPKILLLDEPLSNLDAKLSLEMRNELKRLHQDLKITMIYVTHDQQEALTLSTKIAVYFEGEIVQIAEPRELYHKPANLRVAEFMGTSALNSLKAVYEHFGSYGIIRLTISEFKVLPLAGPIQNVMFTLKPEDIKIHRQPMKSGIEATVTGISPQGPVNQVELKAGGECLTALVIGEAEFEPDSRVWLTFNKDKINIYDRESGSRIRFAWLSGE